MAVSDAYESTCFPTARPLHHVHQSQVQDKELQDEQLQKECDRLKAYAAESSMPVDVLMLQVDNSAVSRRQSLLCCWLQGLQTNVLLRPCMRFKPVSRTPCWSCSSAPSLPFSSLLFPNLQSCMDSNRPTPVMIKGDSPYIQERLLGLSFRISPDAFFQGTGGAEENPTKLKQRRGLTAGVSARWTPC